jgi:hypothetical protein
MSRQGGRVYDRMSCGWAEREPESNDEDILETAKRITTYDRNKDYGHPLENHGHTAEFWSTYLGIHVSVEDVCMMNILQKISRGMAVLTHDTLVDIAGYARNVEMIRDRRDE